MFGPGTEPPPVDLLAPGTVVDDKYRVEAEIAEGGMGRIYRAEQLSLRRYVALKTLRPRASGKHEPEFVARFLREAETCARLTHPNTVRIYDYGHTSDEAGELFYIAMELLSGETLSHRIRRVTRLELTLAFSIVREVARALREAHANGIIHRDLKPGNIMLVPSDEPGRELVKVLDFGIAKVLDEEAPEITREGRFLGSPKYMAPEQIDGGDPIDGRVDVYALGVILYQCIKGNAPFEGARAQEILRAHLTQEPPPLPEGVPAFANEFVMRCLRKSPRDRFADIDSFMDAIARVIDQLRTSLDASSPGAIVERSLVEHIGVAVTQSEVQEPTAQVRTRSPESTAQASGSGGSAGEKTEPSERRLASGARGREAAASGPGANDETISGLGSIREPSRTSSRGFAIAIGLLGAAAFSWGVWSSVSGRQSRTDTTRPQDSTAQLDAAEPVTEQDAGIAATIVVTDVRDRDAGVSASLPADAEPISITASERPRRDAGRKRVGIDAGPIDIHIER